MTPPFDTDVWRSWHTPASSEDTRSRLDRTAASLLRALKPRDTRDARRPAQRALESERVDAETSDRSLLERAAICAHAYARGLETDDDLAESLRVIRELARRTLALHMHPVQLEAAAALAKGRAVELATGEGKTLVATVPTIINAWRNRGVHVLTTNDYLVQRDRALNAPLFDTLGLTSACVTTHTDRDERRAAYRAAITYTTAREACADHLRDRLDDRATRSLAGRIADTALSPTPREPVQRGLASAVVDEADALLIDDAVTPLVLSAQGDATESEHEHRAAHDIATQLEVGSDYTPDERARTITLTRRGLDRITAAFPPPTGPNRAHELALTALRVRHFFERGREYIVENQRVVIVDPSTGRPTPERTWRDGVHEAIEAKEGLEHATHATTLASLPFQRFFRRYRHLCGMSGTLTNCAHELVDVYGLPLVRLETHHPLIRTREPDRLFVRDEDRTRDVVARVRSCIDAERPALVGLRSVDASERTASALATVGIEHRLLNARRPEEEAAIVARAGEPSSVTVATGIAGRGTDILLTDRSRAAGGLHVIVAELHESTRADRQLLGRAGRQGDPGSGVLLASLEDRVLVRHLPPIARTIASSTSSNTVPSTIAGPLLALARSRAEREAGAQRARLGRSDKRAEDAIAFAGASD